MPVPVSQGGVEDKRGRFREIFCAVLEERPPTLPDPRPCDEALTRVGVEPGGTGEPLASGQSGRRLVAAVVRGVGRDCFSNWLEPGNSGGEHVRQSGYDAPSLKVDALSSTANNARQIRDAIMAMVTYGPLS